MIRDGECNPHRGDDGKEKQKNFIWTPASNLWGILKTFRDLVLYTLDADFQMFSDADIHFEKLWTQASKLNRTPLSKLFGSWCPNNLEAGVQIIWAPPSKYFGYWLPNEKEDSIQT